mgnify:CR=1 FL=1
MSITIDDAITHYRAWLYIHEPAPETGKELPQIERARIVLTALEFYRDHAQYHPHIHPHHYCRAKDDEEFVTWVRGWLNECMNVVPSNDEFGSGRLSGFQLVEDWLGTRHKDLPGGEPKPAPSWSDEIRCPWCGKVEWGKSKTPLTIGCSCGKSFEADMKYRVHKIGRVE